ncbi:sigma-54-dependent transcriptional regulator [Williamwhitmania taraxaci]|uniref:DNA-binding transcriptional response regulator, NtrC family, contains REC, AAA-type ATPase, and a Fis-type DNA-binding domains n=1 Tax=Williamwhitmania taraxaci TaxID=1640674 RepID=A0A1G6GVR7_9BACT|nr:sigma-54 dependent transcriptional regulator [Williamwhitmania taraxaci]SDB86122.1 DNA-binding transcriptional response regulator, NtrC family, contains REC, AAA-type ATPase, and a Fis-type DNA-binding domains [Williamwhitmania taraxaci]
MDKQDTILIVDDNKSVLSSLELFLKRKIDKVITCSNPNQIPSLLREERIDLVLLDMNFTAGINSGNEGIFWMREILKADPQMVVVLITAYGDVELAVNAMKEGATDFVLKPWDNQKLLATIQSGLALRKAKRELKEVKQQQLQLQQDFSSTLGEFLGKSPSMEAVFKSIQKVAKTDASILILGENGTGKELVAREIHRLSDRANKIFLSVDLGSISETLFESELFGHTKGAFTDAKEDRAGRFQTASGGTLFLDEIGNLSLPMQAKLLTAIQNREITPLGASKPIAVDIRLLCATNKNIKELVKEGSFREDLLYRINTIEIDLPPLRDRGSDILLIAKHYLKQFADKYDKSKLTLSSKAAEKILEYKWPGNVRELKHAMERAVIMCEGDCLEPEEFFSHSSQPKIELGSSPLSLDDAERILIEASIKRHKGNISKVAKELNIGRQTIYRKIEKYGL